MSGAIVSGPIREFVHFWRRNGEARIQIEGGVGQTFACCGGGFGGCCSKAFDFAALYDSLVELGGWTADTDHEHRWGSKHGAGWKLCEVEGCRMFLSTAGKLERLPDDYDKREGGPCPA